MQRETPYLHDIGLEEAIQAWNVALDAAHASGTISSEMLPVAECLGRVTAAPVWARISSPHYHASAMDGYAVRAEDTAGATETMPKRLVLGVEATYVDTGDPLPAFANAVIMIEDTQLVGEGDETVVEIMAATPPWRHVRPMGEDIVATQLVLPSNHQLRPQDLGAAVGCGHTHLAVRRQPRVAIIPTGTELVSLNDPDSQERLQPGDIIEYNSIVLGAMAEEWGCVVSRFAPLPDDFDMIRSAVVSALAEHDLVVVNAGSSAGSEDFTARVVDSLGQV
ncbi:MAG: molybdopterin biosynthesis protein, partial [Anaerolineae bacterium]|nr:molybdopterin biosynthesis protein [Anaerolineae bacterium]